MRCAWKELLSVLPQWLKPDVDRLGREKLQELRLRLHAPPELVMGQDSIWLNRSTTIEDLSHCVNTASRYSPWAASTSAKGYITAPGGHRIGLCGEVFCQKGAMAGVRNLTSICIRIARDFPGIAPKIEDDRSILILGAPGWGKTTLLRDLIRQESDKGVHIAVVDERGELFPSDFPRGRCTDVLTGCTKSEGIHALLRTMGPSCIAVDEITEEADCRAMLQAAGCGVRLFATAHASNLQDFQQRLVYRPLIENKVFHTVVVLRSDKSWYLERMA